ncbi:MAG: SDR family oxidoreductase [Alphaproteobacteria bacterium]|jgi:NAD(P)-dependent dehydrogenase (short-subunit alcohol dehydrogenase family)|nr:SDR family oxidoreductase [Alphaproteobacteria bacterium]MBU1562887.1 SDR family oxidoreductase [Alphaproteobacteria bacterium]MBU2303133.1 SDR family oxidoreductase [Alphaproteobacteria bacterium]MBU2368464.1 SDR family oxidoreductase [Alphaproteobacteria bacterium]
MTEFARYPSLAGTPVIISGGASGIGESLVRNFAAQGARVGFVDIAVAAGEKLAGELTAAGHTVRFTPCDITDIEAYQAAIAGFAEAHGDALVLVNNAAHDQRHDWSEVTPAYWDDRMAVNLRHAFFAIQAVAPGMVRARRGSIINTGSISWMILTPSLPVYETAKAAMHGLTRAMARELGRSGIRVNSLVPGAILTERQLALWLDETTLQQIVDAQALASHVYPDDVARMALFLAAEDSAMISAQQFLVDGGWAST